VKSVDAFVRDLREEVEAHPAVNHLFLNRLATSPFRKGDYRVFAENHFPLVREFTRYLEQLLVRSPDSEARLWFARVLVDEYGEGSEGKDHATLYGAFLDATGGDAARELQLPARRPAARFIAGHRHIVKSRPFLEGLGAMGPGHEWAIPKMFDAVIPGLRRAGFTEQEIGYFTLHVEQDKDHAAWLEQSLRRYATTEAAQASIRRGALASLDLRYGFWTGVQSAVVDWRQPRSPRQDGPRERTVLEELALTVWDGSPRARAAESRARVVLDHVANAWDLSGARASWERAREALFG